MLTSGQLLTQKQIQGESILLLRRLPHFVRPNACNHPIDDLSDNHRVSIVIRTASSSLLRCFFVES